MKRVLRPILFAVLLLAFWSIGTPATADGQNEATSQNLVADGGFEDWGPAPKASGDSKQPFPTYGADGVPVNWTCSAEITPGVSDPSIKSQTGVYRDQLLKHLGTSSLRLEAGAVTDIIGAYTQFNCEGNSRYKVKCWVRGENIVSLRNEGILVWTRYGSIKDFWQHNVWSAQSPNPHNGTFGWQPYEFTVVSNPTAQTMIITLQLRNASGKAWFDDVEVTKIGTVAAVESY